jgi:hypothetical protein
VPPPEADSTDRHRIEHGQPGLGKRSAVRKSWPASTTQADARSEIRHPGHRRGQHLGVDNRCDCNYVKSCRTTRVIAVQLSGGFLPLRVDHLSLASPCQGVHAALRLILEIALRSLRIDELLDLSGAQ